MLHMITSDFSGLRVFLNPSGIFIPCSVVAANATSSESAYAAAELPGVLDQSQRLMRIRISVKWMDPKSDEQTDEHQDHPECTLHEILAAMPAVVAQNLGAEMLLSGQVMPDHQQLGLQSAIVASGNEAPKDIEMAKQPELPHISVEDLMKRYVGKMLKASHTRNTVQANFRLSLYEKKLLVFMKMQILNYTVLTRLALLLLEDVMQEIATDAPFHIAMDQLLERYGGKLLHRRAESLNFRIPLSELAELEKFADQNGIKPTTAVRLAIHLLNDVISQKRRARWQRALVV